METIFVDNSILSTGVCEEKQRLAYVKHFVPVDERPPLVFGSAFHDAIATYYDALLHDPGQYANAVALAKQAFINKARGSGDALPVSADSDERRSIERGLNLVEAYTRKWRSNDVNHREIIDPSNGEPYIEIGFSVYFMDWKSIPVVYVGKVDHVRESRLDGNVYGWELKTTSAGVKRYVEQIRPNHQLTGYKWALRELMNLNIAGMVLDVVHISDRKVGGKFPTGVDEENDFGRISTQRSNVDIDEFLYDLKLATERFLSLRDSGLRRWHRQAPAACFMYGGCHFRDACASNLNPAIMRNKYTVKPWHPWAEKPKRMVSNLEGNRV